MEAAKSRQQRRKSIHHVDYNSIPEEITCRQLRACSSATYPPNRQTDRGLSRSYEDNQMAYASSKTSKLSLGRCESIDEAFVPTGSKESLSTTISDDQSDFSDSDSGFSGSNKECLNGDDSW